MTSEQIAAVLGDDWESMDSADREAALAIYAHVMDGTHYQRQVDALRDMGWVASAARLRQHLAEQGVTVH